jgi:hypothetical protein
VVLGVGERRILVEPLGTERFRGHAFRAAAIGKRNPHPHHCLRRMG